MRGAILVEDNQDLSAEAQEHLRENHGEAREIGCARPIEITEPPIILPEQLTESEAVRIASYYHDSLTEGPGGAARFYFNIVRSNAKAVTFRIFTTKMQAS